MVNERNSNAATIVESVRRSLRPIPATQELRQVIDSLIENAWVPPEPTLADIRAVVVGDGIFVSSDGELLHPNDRTFLTIELDELIDRHGMQAPARVS